MNRNETRILPVGVTSGGTQFWGKQRNFSVKSLIEPAQKAH